MRIPALILAFAPLLAAQTVERPRILGIANVNVYVSNLPNARAFYKDYLGFDEVAIKRRPGGPEMMAVFKINDNQYIELTAEKPRQDGQRKHMAIYTADIRALRAYLASKGVAVPEDVKNDRLGNTVFNMKDPDGHLIEWVQYAPDSLTAQHRGKLMPDARAAARISHAGILVRDTAAAEAFYKGILGFQGSGDKLKAPDGDDVIELGLNRKDATPDRLNIKNHICFEAPDVPKVVAALQAKPAGRTYREIETHVTGGRQVANLYDPDGSRVEFMEPKPSGSGAKK